MMRPAASTVAGLLLLAVAGWLAPGGTERSSMPTGVSPAAEPLAVALAPLGPAKAVLSSLLWVQMQQKRMDGEVDSLVPLSRALLALHPGLATVREHLATRLILSDAARALDSPRYRALVLAGLALLEEGQSDTDSPQLHEALGQILAIQGRNDSRFWEVAWEFFGAPPEEIAIQELRQAENPRLATLLLADLLLDRGFEAWERDSDAYTAARDLREAQQLIEEVPEGETGFAEERRILGERIAELREHIMAADGER
jgi:hypothetical protein